MPKEGGLLKQFAWCCSGESTPSSQPLPEPTAGANGGQVVGNISAQARLAESGISPGDLPTVAAVLLAVNGLAPEEPPAQSLASLIGSPSADSTTFVEDMLAQRDMCRESGLRRGVTVIEEAAQPSSLQDTAQHQFLSRVMQLQNQVDERLGARGPAPVSRSAPEYRKGSPLWMERPEPESDSDPDMPNLIAYDGVCPASPGSPDTVLGSALDADFDDDDGDATPHVPYSQKQGGLGSCWGQAALKDALKAMDDPAVASGGAGPQPF